MKQQLLLVLLCLILCSEIAAQGLTIQENETGFCSVDGIIDTDVPGYTGDGFANADIAPGTSALWNISVNTSGTYNIYWRYANGGGSGDLFADLWVNESPFLDMFNFTHTGSWTNWTESDTVTVNLQAGENRIRLISISDSGLPNIDFFHVVENGVEPAFCLPSYSLSLTKNDDLGGDVSYEPVQPFYDAGTEITLTATANPGYFFQSWSEGETSAEAVHTFNIQKNAGIVALFYPNGTEAEAGVIGYATVQDDEGTPYLMTGGLGGDTVLASTFNILKTYLESSEPYVVHVEDHIISTGTINIGSNKSLIGVTDSAHLEGIRIKINSSKNVIIRNMTFSKVIQFDEIEINNSHHIWIDGCEFFTDKDHGSEYYDGLLDIKNAASFITVSNTEFHEHFKAILISSGDDSFQDTSIRITFHHNYFHHLGSRTPLLRFGKAHIFNNYFKNCNSGINSRMGACIRVEENYFYHVSNATRTDMSVEVGRFDLINNIFESSTYVTEPTCELEVPYEYQSALDVAADVPLIVAGEDPTSVPDLGKLYGVNLKCFPNPSNGPVEIVFSLPSSLNGQLMLFDQLGRAIKIIDSGLYSEGENSIGFSTMELPSGMYFIQLKTELGTAAQRILVK